MQVKLVIDAIVRQTTVLIAQLATSTGMRAPLAHIANQTFLTLTQELERQGIGQKVIADMFGLALRSYQQKVQRLSESATDRGRTLWEAVHDYLRNPEFVSRADVLRRFAHDDQASVRGILNDMVDSGLVYKTGRGDATVYRAASIEDLARASERQASSAAEALAWVCVYREGPLDQATLRQHLPPISAYTHAERCRPDAITGLAWTAFCLTLSPERETVPLSKPPTDRLGACEPAAA